MELLLDTGEGGTLRGLCSEGGDVGTIRLPEGVTSPATEVTENTETGGELAGARADAEALLTLRRRLLGRTVRPQRGFMAPR